MPTRPNIVVITTHDSGCHFGCYGVPTVRTPHIDGLSAEGVRFTRLYASAPICSPSRASLMTGQYPSTHGLMGLTGISKNGRTWGGRMTNPQHHLGHALRGVGYLTALFGHQHEIGEPDQPGHELINPAGPGVDRSPLASHAAHGVAERFAGWVRGPRDTRPFFAQIGFHETHTPYTHGGVTPDQSRGLWVPPYCTDDKVRAAFKGLSGALPDPENDESLRRHLAQFQGSLHAADLAVGIILQALRDAGIEEETLVLFNTDHGPELPHAKWTVHDAGCRIAFIMRWPGGGIRGGATCDQLLSNIDFAPTLTELLGLPLAQPFDGVSFAPLVRSRWAGPGPREDLISYMHYGNVFSLRTPRYNLIRCLKGGVRPDAGAPNGYDTRYPFELFDTALDPLELRDVSREPAYAEDFPALAERFWRKLEGLRDPILETPLEG